VPDTIKFITEPGEKYENLCESYAIFITENDIMKVGLPIYHIEIACLEMSGKSRIPRNS
jgi:hypothetical protein